MYIRGHGEPFWNIASATQRCACAPQSFFTKRVGGTQCFAALSSHSVGTAVSGGGSGGAAEAEGAAVAEATGCCCAGGGWLDPPHAPVTARGERASDTSAVGRKCLAIGSERLAAP